MKGLIIFVLTTVIAWNAYADQPKYCNVKFPDDAIQTYPEAVKSATEALKGLCDTLEDSGKISADALNDLFVRFHGTLETEAYLTIPDLMPYLGFFSHPLFDYQDLKATALLPDVMFITDPNDPEDTIYVQATGSQQRNYEQAIPRDTAIKCFRNDACRTNLKAYRDVLFFVYNPFRAETVTLSQDFITAKDKEWMKFIDESRSQTFIDIAVTSLFYEKRYGKSEHDFQSPPEVQWFALHPSVLIENVSDAVDGQELKESLALEVIGFNYWNDKCFGIACGASLIVNYADREGVDDIGWGVMFHADNSYSFGVTQHGGDTGFFVTADLLKLFQDKKSSFDQYKDKYRNLVKQ